MYGLVLPRVRCPPLDSGAGPTDAAEAATACASVENAEKDGRSVLRVDARDRKNSAALAMLFMRKSSPAELWANRKAPANNTTTNIIDTNWQDLGEDGYSNGAGYNSGNEIIPWLGVLTEDTIYNT